MKKITIIIVSLIVLLGGTFFFFQNRQVEKQQMDAKDDEQKTVAKQNWESKTDNQSMVTVIVTPIDISSESKEWKFNIVMDTHAVELNQDLVQSAVLIDEQGKEYEPLRFEGASRGHHREGVLFFNQILPFPQSVEMKISGVGDSIRSFVWQLN